MGGWSRGTPSITNDKSHHVTDIQDKQMWLLISMWQWHTGHTLNYFSRQEVRCEVARDGRIRVVTNCWVSYRVMPLSRPSSSLSPQHRSRVSLRTSASRPTAGGEPSSCWLGPNASKSPSSLRGDQWEHRPLCYFWPLVLLTVLGRPGPVGTIHYLSIYRHQLAHNCGNKAVDPNCSVQSGKALHFQCIS